MENVKVVVRFVRAFILAEPDIAIDAREVSSGLAAGLKVRVELQQERLERLEQAAKSSHHVPIVAFPVLIEPSFVVVLRELAKEVERVRSESDKRLPHDPSTRNEPRYEVLGCRTQTA